jgi:hypothetical protein
MINSKYKKWIKYGGIGLLVFFVGKKLFAIGSSVSDVSYSDDVNSGNLSNFAPVPLLPSTQITGSSFGLNNSSAANESSTSMNDVFIDYSKSQKDLGIADIASGIAKNIGIDSSKNFTYDSNGRLISVSNEKIIKPAQPAIIKKIKEVKTKAIEIAKPAPVKIERVKDVKIPVDNSSGKNNKA